MGQLLIGMGLIAIAGLIVSTPAGAIRLDPATSRRIILGGTVLLQLVGLWLLWPALNEDLPRYRVEGMTWLSGRSPYVTPPVAMKQSTLLDYVDRLTPERGYWRLGWGVLDTDELYQPLDGTAAPRSGSVGIDDLTVRVERETLRRFPRTGAVLFTIRTYLRPLRDVAGDTDRLGRLLEALATMPDDIARYKQLEAIRPALAGLLSPDDR